MPGMMFHFGFSQFGGSGGAGGVSAGRSSILLLKTPRKSRGKLTGAIRFAPVPPVVGLTAVQVPTPLALSQVFLANAENSTGSGVPVSRAVADGQTFVASKWNRNAAAQDILTQIGGGAYAVYDGLDLTAPNANLAVTVAAGQAIIGGLVEVPADKVVPLTDNTALIWIWLLQNGTLVPVNTDTTPPAAACCLLGCVTTNDGSVRGIDTSGVFYMRGGHPWRRTMDAGMPTDVPPTTLAFHHRTLGGLYFWDGTAYSLIGS